MKASFIIAAVVHLGISFGVALPQDYAVDWHTIDGGGATVIDGGGYEVGGAIGQPDAGKLAGGNYTLTGGFWAIAPPPDKARRPMPEDCAGIPPGDRCNAIGTCVTDADCAFESHCLLAPDGEGGDGICYAPKTRYLSISPHPGQRSNTARRIRIADGAVLGWVDVPAWIEPTAQHGGLWLSAIADVPAYDEIDFPETWPDVLHLSDCQIAPGQTYEIQAIEHGRNIGAEINYSDALALRTNSTWGDTVSTCVGDVCQPANGVPGLDDIMAAITYFQGTPVAPITWLDIAPSAGLGHPDQIIGLDDIMGCINGFQGGSYPGSGPLGCGGSQARADKHSDSQYPESLGRRGYVVLPDLSQVRTDRAYQAPSPSDAILTEAVVSVVPAATHVQPGEPVSVNVYVSDGLNIGGYEVVVDISGGTSGSLVLDEITIDAERDDFIFAGFESLQAVDESRGRICAVAITRAADAVGPLYLGTFLFRASADAGGTFYVNPRAADGALLRDAFAVPIAIEPGTAVAITVGSSIRAEPAHATER